MHTRPLATAALLCLAFAGMAATTPQQQKQEQPDSTSFAIVEMGSSNELKLDDVQTSVVRIPLTIEERSRKDVPNVQVRVTEFISTQGVIVVPDWMEKTVPTLKKGSQARLILTVQLPVDGTYRATVRLVAANRISNTGTIEIKRARAQPPLEIPDLTGVVIALDPVRDEESAVIETTLYPRGEDVRLEQPLLHSFIRKEKNDSTTGVRERGSLTLVAPETAPIVVAAGQEHPLKLRLTGIRHPGRYDAAIRFRTADSSWVTKTASVYARDAWWLAAAYILLGIMAGLLLRAYGATVRPRLVMKQRVAGLIEQLDAYEAKAADDAASVRLIRAIRANILARFDRLATAGTLGGTTELDLYLTIIPAAGMFVDIRQRLKELPEEIRRTFEKQLDEPERILGDPATDAEGVKTQVSALAKTARDAERAVDIDVKIRAAESELANDKRPALNEVRTALAEARRLLLEGKTGDAEGELRKAARKYAENVVAALDTATTGEPPSGILKADWTALQKTIAAAENQLAATSDADQAKGVVDAVLSEYVRVMTDGLAKNVAEAAKNVPDPTRYDEVVKALAAIRNERTQGHVLAAWSQFDAARKRFNELLPRGAGSAMGAEAAAAEAPSAASGAMFDLLLTLFPDRDSAADLFKPGALKKVTGRLDRWDAYAAGLIFVVAMLIGLQVLWADNLTWGGWKSYLAAFLWGFAFNQFTHGGLVSLLKKE